ncbi:pleckstrin homology domain-containing family G member 4B [Dugong dugon]
MGGALADFPQEGKESCPAAWRAHLALLTAVPRRGRQTFRAAWGGGRQNRGVLREGERVLSPLLTAVSLKPKAAPVRGVAPRRAVKVLNRHQDSDDRDRGEFWAGGVTPGRESSRPGEAVQTQYPTLTALQEGWPLCDQGKVVVQLATLLRVRLRPGNFYLHETGHIAVPEAMYGQVFTGEFLEQVSADRGSFPLHSCLLTTGTAIHHALWGSITDPTSVLQGHPQPEHPPLSSTWEAPAPAMAGPLSRQGAPTLYPGCLDGGPTMPLESSDGDLEGPRVGPGPMDRRGSTEASYRGGPSPEPRGRWFRKSYVEALRNPVPLGSSSEESFLEEAADAAPRCLAQGSRPRAAASPVQRGPAPFQRPLESQPPTDRDPRDSELRAPSQVLGVSPALLQLGTVTLPGTRDRSGRAVVQVCTGGPLWAREHASSAELTCLLMYLHSIPRKEVQDLGLVILVDARKGPIAPALSQALEALQNTVPPVIHSILLLVDKESAFRPDKDTAIQCEVVSSLKALHKLIDSSQLTAELDGSFPYSHSDWVCFQRKLESFTANCKQAISFLQNSVCSLNTHRALDTAQEVTELISMHRAMMKCVLEDTLLVTLRLEGGAVLARLRRDEFVAGEDSRDAIEAATRLYDCVDEEVHRLVLSSNRCLQQLEGLQELRQHQEGQAQCPILALRPWSGDWQCELNVHLTLGKCGAGTPQHQAWETGTPQNQARGAGTPQHEARGRQGPLSTRPGGDRDPSAPAVLILFLGTEGHGEELQSVVTHTVWAHAPRPARNRCHVRNGGARCVKQWFEREQEPSPGPVELASPENEKEKQEAYQGFHEAAAMVGALLATNHVAALLCPQHPVPTQHPSAHTAPQCPHSTPVPTQHRCPSGAHRIFPVSPREAAPGRVSVGGGLKEQATRWRPPSRKHPETPLSSPDAEHLGSCCRVAATAEPGPDGRWELWRCQALWSQGPKTGHCLEDALPEAAPGCSSPPFPQEASPSGQDILSAQEDMHLGPGVPVPWDTQPSRGGSPDNSSPYYLEPAWAPGPHLRKHPLKKIMKKTQSFESPMTDGGPREPRQLGHIGVHIKGLEVTSNVASKTPPLPQNCSLSSPSRVHHPEGDGRPRSGSRRLSSVSGSIGPGVAAAHICELIGRLHHIMAEMLSTEREYVRSLGYVIDNYFPEMERMDLPQDLRGKRGTIFGNLEKLHDFHCRHFLRELERCRHCPLAMGCSFLKHEEQFSMYALYSKNKPRSDALLSSHGNAFFKAKQQALGDKMDLASYLLKPVQRMSKYALLLKDLVKEAGHSPTQEQELGQLRAAEDMVRFQLRHGNDLLAMDAVRGCDVNLKEQGPLRCQDEFVVCCGRRKYLRQVFLFEDLILFSKTKKMDGGYDIYVYKQSFKTAEIGMTENVGDSGLRFEIWFRRRRRSQDTYILQASSVEVKSAWTSIIGRILWRQALRNRELRMQEMVSMGIGNKPFMDIKPSDAAISDRAIDYIVKGTARTQAGYVALVGQPGGLTESRSRASVAVSSFDHATPFKRPHSTISDSSTSSSSSQSSSVLGSLNLHVYPSPPGLLSTSLCPWPYDVRACIEEDELEQETGSQPSMTTESSGSSQGTSGDSASSLRSPPHPGLSRLEDNCASTPGSRSSLQGTSPAHPGRTSQWRLGGGQLTTSNKAPHVSGLSTVV